MKYRKTSFQICVSGRKGQGKTALTDAIARDRSRVVVFDVLAEYGGKGYVTVHSRSELLGEIMKRWRKGYRIAYVPSGHYEKELSDLTDMLCAIQKPYKDTPDGKVPPIPKILFVVEEMAWSYPSHPKFPGFKKITTLGRHYGIDCIGTTQRIAEISTKFRGTSDARFFFAQEEHTDITTILKMVGPEHKRALMTLKPHEYLRMYNGTVAKGRNRLK